MCKDADMSIFCLSAYIVGFVLIISLHEQTTLTALGEMFEAARSIMSWLGDCAKVCHQYGAVLACHINL